MAATDPLIKLYKCLAGRGALPLDPDDPYYVEIQEASPETDPILALWNRIDMAESESVNLLTGFRGNGKSTELRRLKRLLEKSGCKVFLVDMLDYVLMTKPVELSDFILSLMAALAEKIQEKTDLSPLSGSYWERMRQFLASEVSLEGIDLTGKGPGAAAKFALTLKTDPGFKAKVQKRLEGHLTRLVEEAQQFVDGLAREIRKTAKNRDAKVVLLVDSLEQLRGTGEEAKTIYDSVVELFAGQSANLRFPKLHVVYTVPPYLTVLAHNLGRILGGNPITQWPNIHVRTVADGADEQGLALMESVVTRRFADWERIVPRKALRRLAQASGGDLRDFFRLVRECVVALRTARRSDPQASLEEDAVARVVRQLRNELLPLAEEDARWLARIHAEKRAALGSEKDLPTLARFLDSNLIMNYLNGEPWYDIHPLLVQEIECRQ